MAFDFPNSPSVGQRVTGVGGIVYVWDGVKWTNSVGGVTVQSMGDVGRNLLHNPLFNVAQRGAGPWTTTTYTADRWWIARNTDTVSVSIIGAVDANRAAIGDEAATYLFANTFIGNAAAAAYNTVTQSIENVRRLTGKTVTVSFWAACGGATLRLGVSIDQNFSTGSGGSPTVFGTGQSVTLSTTWTRYSCTFTLGSLAGKTIGSAGNDSTNLNFWYSSSTNNATLAGAIGVQSGTIYLWGMQLEIGSVATPLEKPDPRYDLANCQRFCSVGFFEAIGNSYVANGYIGTMVYLPVSLRAAPTVLVPVWNTQTNVAGPTVVTMSITSFLAYAQAIAPGNTVLSGSFIVSADL